MSTERVQCACIGTYLNIYYLDKTYSAQIWVYTKEDDCSFGSMDLNGFYCYSSTNDINPKGLSKKRMREWIQRQEHKLGKRFGIRPWWLGRSKSAISKSEFPIVRKICNFIPGNSYER